MFERFTDRARRVVVLAQEQTRALNHNYIGTEHLLLGLVGEGGGVAAKVLAAFDATPEVVRREVEEIVGRGQVAPVGHIPFTPRAKKVMEGSLREALQLNHNYIGTEHVLLGLIGQTEGVGAQVLTKLGISLKSARQQVIAQLQVYGKGAVAASGGGSGPWAVTTEQRPAPQSVTGPGCERCAAPLDQTAVYKILDVPEHEGDGKATVLFLYCRACGHTLDDIILPDLR